MHITASVYINDAEDGLLHDYDVWLEKLAPHAPTAQYQHNRTGEDNADAHMKRQIMDAKALWQLPKAGWISGRGNKTSTERSNGAGASGGSGRILEDKANELVQCSAPT